MRSILALMAEVKVLGLAHITGGGITENLPRVFPDGLGAELDTSSWQQRPVFDWLAKHGNIAIDEMRRTFNCGIGMAVVVSAKDVDSALALLDKCGESARVIGTVVAGHGEVSYL